MKYDREYISSWENMFCLGYSVAHFLYLLRGHTQRQSRQTALSKVSSLSRQKKAVTSLSIKTFLLSYKGGNWRIPQSNLINTLRRFYAAGGLADFVPDHKHTNWLSTYTIYYYYKVYHTILLQLYNFRAYITFLGIHMYVLGLQWSCFKILIL